MSSMLAFDSVFFQYEQTDRDVLRGVTFDVVRGEFVCIVGHNGSGKSTLAKLCNGLFTPTGGCVRVNGLDVAQEDNLTAVRQSVGMVFQNPDNQLVATMVEEDVAFGPENIGVPSQEIRRRVDAALAQVGMTDFAERSVYTLSGGQKQRVAIAGALALQPHAIVFDEPTAMLDPSGRAEVMAAIRKLNQQGITIVLITHFMQEALNASRIIALEEGQIAYEGTPESFFADAARVATLGLDVPRMCALAGHLRKGGLAVKTAFTPQDMAEELAKKLKPNAQAGEGGAPAEAIPGIAPADVAVPGVAQVDATPEPAPSLGQKTAARESEGTLPSAQSLGQPVAKEVNSTQEATAVQEVPAQETASASQPAQPLGQAESLSEGQPAQATSPIIQFRDVSHVYMPGTPMQQKGLDAITLDIAPGQSVGLIGHTGSGKTTLAQHINALLLPTSGELRVCGMEVAQKSLRRNIRAQVGLVFQYPEYQLFEETIAKDIAFGPHNMGLEKAEIDRRVHEAIAQVGLGEELLARSPFELSGGQKRRAAIAGVLSMQPKILILDEPTAGLDPAGRDEMLTLIESLHSQGTTVLMISHSMEDVARVCQRVLVLQGGRLVDDGTPQQVFARGAALSAMGLAVPDVYVLQGLLAERGIRVPPKNTLEDMAQAILTLGRAAQ